MGNLRERLGRLHPKAFLALHALGGVAAAVALVWGFLAIADAIPESSWLMRADNGIVAGLQSRGSETGEAVFAAITHLGDVGFGIVMAIAIVAFVIRHHRARAIGLFTASAGGTLLDNLLKAIFHRGRPEYATEFITRASWSFPSGHATNSITGYGFLAFLLITHTTDRRRRWAIGAGAALLILIVGFSRIYLGVHYPSDVLGGYLAGGIWLIACIMGYRFAQERALLRQP